jgi:hypothetical protein
MRHDRICSLNLRGAAALAALVACLAAWSIPASADPKPIPRDSRAGSGSTWDGQRVVESAAKNLDTVAAHDPAWGATSVDAAANTVWISRTAPPDARWRARYDASRKVSTADQKSAASAVLVRYRITLFTAQQVQALFALVHSKAPGLRAAGTLVQQWQPGPDGQPFEVHYTGKAPAAASVQQLQVFGPGTVRFVRDRGATVSLTRNADTPPYYGGALVRNKVGAECSTGFGTISPNRVTYMLTAGHCVNPNDHRMFTGAGRLVGNADQGDRDLDMAYIKTSAAPRIFDGALGAGEFSKLVIGNFGYSQGVSVCTSGAVMHTVCNNRIVGPAEWYVYNAFTQTYYTARGYRIGNVDDKPMVANGDSGAPVFSIWQSGSSGQVAARGVVSGAPSNFETSCPTSLPRSRCYTQANVVDTGAIQNRRNLAFTW